MVHETTTVRLLCKVAERQNGVDVRRFRAGDIFDLSEDEATALIEGGWAEPVANPKDTRDPKPDSE